MPRLIELPLILLDIDHFKQMNYPAASYGASKTPRNEAGFGEYNPERFNKTYW